MLTLSKKQSIMKLFLGFPSVQTMAKEPFAAMLSSYLENIQSFSDDAVSEAVEATRKMPGQFPPSAGEIYEACAAIQSRKFREDQNRRARIEHRREEFSEEHREMMRQKWAALLEELKSGVNFDPNYGLVPRGTKPAKPIVERTVPPSYIEKWEREKGYRHPHRERVLALVNGDTWKDAAE